MPIEEVLTYLAMTSPDALVPAPVPAGGAIRLVRQARYSPAIRQLTLRIGQAYHWPSQGWDDQRWMDYLARPTLRHWVATAGAGPVGLLSLNVAGDGDVEVDTFGLLPDFVGRGLGGHFLTLGVRLAWRLEPQPRRLWLHTSSRDHPNALRNYLRRGFRRFPGPGTTSAVGGERSAPAP